MEILTPTWGILDTSKICKKILPAFKKYRKNVEILNLRGTDAHHHLSLGVYDLRIIRFINEICEKLSKIVEIPMFGQYADFRFEESKQNSIYEIPHYDGGWIRLITNLSGPGTILYGRLPEAGQPAITELPLYHTAYLSGTERMREGIAPTIHSRPKANKSRKLIVCGLSPIAKNSTIIKVQKAGQKLKVQVRSPHRKRK